MSADTRRALLGILIALLIAGCILLVRMV